MVAGRAGPGRRLEVGCGTCKGDQTRLGHEGSVGPGRSLELGCGLDEGGPTKWGN